MADLVDKFDDVEDLLNKRSRDTRAAHRQITHSLAWFKNKVNKELNSTSVTPEDLLRNRRGVNAPIIGQMFAYKYDPKTKDKLPFYDTFPLIFVIKILDDGFQGINLHYLPLRLRAKLLSALRKTTSSKLYSREVKIRLSYDMIKTVSQFAVAKPAFKRYLTNHVKSKMIRIHPQEWHNTIFLPVERFEKETKEYVWADTLRQIKGG